MWLRILPISQKVFSGFRGDYSTARQDVLTDSCIWENINSFVIKGSYFSLKRISSKALVKVSSFNVNLST